MGGDDAARAAGDAGGAASGAGAGANANDASATANTVPQPPQRALRFGTDGKRLLETMRRHLLMLSSIFSRALTFVGRSGQGPGNLCGSGIIRGPSRAK